MFYFYPNYSHGATVTSGCFFFSLFISWEFFRHGDLPSLETHPRRDASAQKANIAKRRRCVGAESCLVCGVTPGYPVSAPESAECSLHCLLSSLGSFVNETKAWLTSSCDLPFFFFFIFLWMWESGATMKGPCLGFWPPMKVQIWPCSQIWVRKLARFIFFIMW